MVCENCDPRLSRPGRLVRVNNLRKELCAECGEDLQQTRWNHERDSLSKIHKAWDTYFLGICFSVAAKSPCLSRKIGAILVRDHSIISTGYNGPPRGVPHCGRERYKKDEGLSERFRNTCSRTIKEISETCPRKLLGYESGTHMELCPAQHAEENAVSNAARLGVSVLNSTLYTISAMPCKNCFGTLINAGTTEIVVEKAKVYDVHTQFLINNSKIEIREFEL